jgi:hypothetical protein
MQAYLLPVVTAAAVYLILLAPFIILAYAFTRPRPGVNPLILFIIFMLVDGALIFSHRIVPLVPSWGGWNWQGKLLEAAFPVVLGLAVPAFSAGRIGLKLPAPRAWRTLLITCVLYALIGIPVMLLMGAHFGIDGDLPTFAFQASMPGLAEEIMYRGLMLTLLNEAFGRPWKFAGIRLGWGFVIVTAMFGMVHGVDAKSPGDVHIYWSGMIFPALTGAVLAWLKERTGSLWPCVLFHNFVNVLNHFMV